MLRPPVLALRAASASRTGVLSVKVALARPPRIKDGSPPPAASYVTGSFSIPALRASILRRMLYIQPGKKTKGGRRKRGLGLGVENPNSPLLHPSSSSIAFRLFTTAPLKPLPNFRMAKLGQSVCLRTPLCACCFITLLRLPMGVSAMEVALHGDNNLHCQGRVRKW